jgi:hypothetical protein
VGVAVRRMGRVEEGKDTLTMMLSCHEHRGYWLVAHGLPGGKLDAARGDINQKIWGEATAASPPNNFNPAQQSSTTRFAYSRPTRSFNS